MDSLLNRTNIASAVGVEVGLPPMCSDTLGLDIFTDSSVLPDCSEVDLSRESACPCFPHDGIRLLWEEELRGTDGNVIGWLTAVHVADDHHAGSGHGAPKQIVKYYDLRDRRASKQSVHDVTETQLGQWVIRALHIINPDGVSALPKPHLEWLAWAQRLALEMTVQDLQDACVDVTGLNESEIVPLWLELQGSHRAASPSEGNFSSDSALLEGKGDHAEG